MPDSKLLSTNGPPNSTIGQGQKKLTGNAHYKRLMSLGRGSAIEKTNINPVYPFQFRLLPYGNI